MNTSPYVAAGSPSAQINFTTRLRNRRLSPAISHARFLLCLFLVWILICQTTMPLGAYAHSETDGINLSGAVGFASGMVLDLSPSSGVSAEVSADDHSQLTIFGPRRFDRTTGPPNNYVEQFSLSASATSPFTLHIQNGEANGLKRLSSAIIKLNGSEVLAAKNINQNVAGVERAVSLLPSNILEVRLASEPGSFLIINITGPMPVTDTAPPTLKVITPVNNLSTTDSALDFSGTATDSGASATGVAHVYVNDVEAVFDEANSNWNLTGVPLIVGANEIVVRAVDYAGNETRQVVSITRVLPNQSPNVVAGSDQVLALPQSANLHGTVSDDGLPLGSTLSTNWSVVSGPGPVTFSSSSSIDTTANFNTPGAYVLKLSASDGHLSSSDDVNITVHPENHAPSVGAGLDQTLALPSQASLNGSVSDDGLPEGSVTTTNWSVVNGPGTVTFANSGMTVTTAAFSQAGTYVLKLTVSDSELTASDEVQITVIPENHAPTVDAGADQTIALQNTLALNGIVADDSLPQGSSITVTWSKASGPGNVSFTDSNTSTTQVSFETAGAYVLRLTANDSELSSSDEVTIAVTDSRVRPIADFVVPQSTGAAGAFVIASSGAASGSFTPDKILDNNPATFWTTPTVSNQFVKLQFFDQEMVFIDRIRLQGPGGTPNTTIKDFEVQISSTTSADPSFTSVLSAAYTNDGQLQEFLLPGGPAHARFLKFIPKTNYGSGSSIQIATLNPVAVGSADSVITLRGQNNVALAGSPGLIANGAAIYRSSYPGGTASANGLLGYNNGGWSPVLATNPYAVIELSGGRTYMLNGVKLATSYDSGFGAANAVSGFEVWVSSTSPDDIAFIKVLSATAAFTPHLQKFIFPGGPVSARYVKYVPLANGGGLTVNTQSFDVIAEEVAQAVAASGDNQNQFNPPESAFDGDDSSIWYSPNAVTSNVWVKTSLAKAPPQKVYGVRITPVNDFTNGQRGPKDFEIRVSTSSTDDAAFTTVFSGTLQGTFNGGAQEFLFSDLIDARYVQFFWKNAYTTSNVGVRTLEVLAAPTAGSAIVSVSSQESAASNALDLDPSNQWITALNQPALQWMKLLLPRAELWTINHLALRPASATNGNFSAPKDFELQVSNTDSTDASFATVLSATLADSTEFQDFYFAPVQARYVRLLLKTNHGGGGRYGLAGFYLFSATQIGSSTRFIDRSTDADGSIVAWSWDFGDGTLSHERHPVHNFPSPGNYLVTLTVTDNSGLTSTRQISYSVIESNRADFAFSPGIAHEGGESVRFTDTTQLLSDANTSRRYDFGDGIALTQATGISFHQYADGGTFPVTLRIGNPLGIDYSVTRNVLVLNMAPTVDIDAGKTIVWGEPWTSVPAISDQGTVDRLSLHGVWDFADGQTSSCLNCTNANATVTHTYDHPGIYTAVLTVSDKDGASASDSAVYTVNKRPVSLAFQPTPTVELGQLLNLRVRLMDSFANQPLANRSVSFKLNTTDANATTDADGYAEVTITFAAGPGANMATAIFAEEEFYVGGSTYRLLPGPVNQKTCKRSSTGTDFWLMFPGNDLTQARGPQDGILLDISSEVTTSGAVTILDQNITKPFSVLAHTTTRVRVDSEQSTSNQIENRGIHVVSQHPVTVYGLSNVRFTVDAYLALPTASLGNSYLVLGYNNGGAVKGTQFGLVASAPNTTVSITPSVSVGTRLAGVPFNINLNQGQTYLLKDETGSTTDLSGTFIQSDKPLAVFGGHKCANIPAPTSYCDYLVEQLPPVDSWGTHFATLPLATRTKGDTFRFLAATDNTHVFLNGSGVVTLNRGQFLEKIVEGASEITSDYPILVAQYSNSHLYDGLVGDPSMMLVPPLDHYLNDYTISSLSGFGTNLINVVAPSSDVGLVTIDGTAISVSSFVPIRTTGASGAQIAVNAGTHTLSGPHPFGVFVYGFNEDVSYGYPGSACLSSELGPTTLILSPKSQTVTIGTSSCLTATLTDQGHTPVNNRNVTLTVAGAHPQSPSVQVTDALGRAELCYSASTTGDDLLTATSESVSDVASVTWRLPNQSPVVDAGIDQTLTMPSPVHLAGVVTDDGLPVNTVVISWSKISGPGNVIFGDANSVATSATFSAAGVYVLRLDATDSSLSAGDDVQISVNPAPVNQAPTANAGPDLITTISGNLVINGGDDQSLSEGEIPGWTEVQGTTWTQANNSLPGFPESQRGNAYFHAGNTDHAELRQDVDLSAYSSAIAAGALQFEFKAYLRSFAEPAPDSARVIVEYRDEANTNLIASLNSGEIVSKDEWHLTEDVRVAPPGTGWIRIRLIATRSAAAPTNAGNDAFFDSISLRPVGASAVSLSGSLSDDGLPSGSTLSGSWSVISGPVTLATPNTPFTNALFNTAGTYVLRLTSSDGELSTSDDVVITVYPANQPPTVNAGPNQTVVLPAAVSLAGVVNDDGQPNGSSLSIAWSKISGPGTVTFADPSAAMTLANFGATGNYVLRLTADDSEYSASADINISVNPAPGPINQPPTVTAGPNQTISLPINIASLNGSVTDDGLPAGNVLTVSWIRVSGPGTVIFGNAGDPITTAQFSAIGNYVLRLTASDGAYTVWADVGITLTPPNQPPTAHAGEDQSILLSQQAQLNGSITDDGLPSGNSVAAIWSIISGPGSVTFANEADVVTSASFSAKGAYVLRLTATDGQLSEFDDVTITVDENVAAPNVEITSPADGEELTQPSVITGSVSNGSWLLEYSLNSQDGAANQGWTKISSGVGPKTNSPLGTLDTTLLVNGIYTLRLKATDDYRQTSVSSIAVLVEKNYKVGQFQVAFNDLSVPLAGLPIEVVRSYDSRDKRVGDFGVGWTLALRNARVEKTGVLGLSWFQTVSSGAIPTYCLEPTRPHKVAITFADGRVFKFLASAAIHCQQFVPVTSTHLTFAAEPGTHASLEVVGPDEVIVESQGSLPGPVNLLNQSNPDIFNSSTFRLMTAEGAVFVIDQQAGVRSVRDPYGNTLSIEMAGIIHSSGQSVLFSRDSLGRITHITDPNGNAQTYEYDANGDLHKFTDREQNTTTLTYDANHYLSSITDARGVELLTNQYDANGRLLSQSDAFNTSLTYDHDIAGRVETITDRLGHATRYEYDQRGNVLRQLDALGGARTFTYDDLDNLLTETNALGKTTSYTYDAADNRTSVTDSLGNLTRFTYNGARQPLTVTDPLGRVTSNTYDAAGNNLLSTTDGLEQTTTYTYNLFTGQRTSMKDALSNSTFYGYDSAGRVSNETDALGHVMSFGYDSNGNRTSQTVTRTNAQGQTETITTTYVYDRLNRLTKTLFVDGSFTVVEYNQIGQQSATIDQLGHRTAFTYDEMGRLERTDFPDDTYEETSYDAEGQRLTSTDRSGRITSYNYDELGRLIRTVYPDHTFSTTTYDAAGQVLTSTDARGNVTRYFYDDAGRRTKFRNALDQETRFSFDANGNQISITDPLGHATTYDYDAANRRTKTTYTDGSFDVVGYDALGRIVSRTDQAGKTTQFVYDALGRLTRVIDALNQETIYTHNELGQQVLQTDANNHTTRFEYDQLGRRVKRTLPLGQFETYGYDLAGNLQSRTDFNGKTTSFSYDLMRRLLKKIPDASLNQSTISFTYNTNGLRASMTDASGVTGYAYDVRDRLASRQTPVGTLTYSYDEVGNLSTVRSSNANGTSVDYTYDALNRLSATQDNRLLALNGGLTHYNYDGVGNLQDYTYPNNLKTSYQYNSLNRLTSLSVTTSSASVRGYAYTLGAVGNRTRVSELNGRTIAYTYDDLYRLTGETIANDAHGINGAIGYDYDAVGNRRSRSSTVSGVAAQTSLFDANDRLTSDSYDANGNTTFSNGAGYSYDFENHLTSVITSDSSVISLKYDGDGNRVAKTVNGVTTGYLVDTNNPTGYAQVIEELQGGAVTKQFTYGHDLISQRCVTATPDCSLSLYGYDGHGSVRFLTNSGAAVTDTYDYDAFGNLVSRTGTTSNDYLYAGEQLDGDLGFYYLRARFMNPTSGRFWSMDSYEGRAHSSISLHKYLYADQNPTMITDPSGQVGVAEVIGHVVSISLRVSVFALYSQRLHSAIELVGAAYSLATFVGGTDEERYGTIAAVGGPAAAAEILARQATVINGVARSFLNIGIATGATSVSVAEMAAAAQMKGGYARDPWRDIIARKGEILFCGEPGASGFFTTERTVVRAGGDASNLFQGLQARPFEVEPGVWKYRPGVTAFEVMEDTPAAFGLVRANISFGEGRYPQVYLLPGWEQKLRPLVTYRLTNTLTTPPREVP